MLIISYDKKLALNIGNHWYYKFTTEKKTYYCSSACIKEFSHKNEDLYRIRRSRKRDYAAITYNCDIHDAIAYQLVTDIIKPYVDVINSMKPSINDSVDLDDYNSKLPSINDVKKHFPPQDPKYKYDEYGFPYIDIYRIYLELQINSKNVNHLVGLYTDKSKYDAVNQEIIKILKKDGKCIDFSEL